MSIKNELKKNQTKDISQIKINMKSIIKDIIDKHREEVKSKLNL